MTVQLTNPNILDLTEWQKVINEINQLSARIDAITTSQGGLQTTPIDWNSATLFSQQFNIGNQKILFGKEKFTVPSNFTSGNFYDGDISFSATTGVGAFSAKPIVTASIIFGSQTVPSSSPDAVITLFNPSASGFNYRLTNAGSHTKFTSGSYFYINWIAIGPL